MTDERVNVSPVTPCSRQMRFCDKNFTKSSSSVRPCEGVADIAANDMSYKRVFKTFSRFCKEFLQDLQVHLVGIKKSIARHREASLYSIQ